MRKRTESAILKERIAKFRWLRKEARRTQIIKDAEENFLRKETEDGNW